MPFFSYAVITAIFIITGLTSCKSKTDQVLLADNEPVANDEISGELYYDSNSSPEQAYMSSSGENKQLFEKLRRPTAKWITGPLDGIDAYLGAAGNKKGILIAYYLNNRDCTGGHSGGGAANAQEYRQWASDFASRVGQRSPIIIIEPDAIPDADQCGNADERFESLKHFVQELKSKTNAWVYLDAGNSNWIDANTVANNLAKAGVADARGFALNVSNYIRTKKEFRYGRKIIRALKQQGIKGKKMVIDRSRNGKGSNGKWCNPEGRGVGGAPKITRNKKHIDAYLWLKVPGESDGTKDGGHPCGEDWVSGSFNVGQFHEGIALQLARNSISEGEVSQEESEIEQEDAQEGDSEGDSTSNANGDPVDDTPVEDLVEFLPPIVKTSEQWEGGAKIFIYWTKPLPVGSRIVISSEVKAESIDLLEPFGEESQFSDGILNISIASGTYYLVVNVKSSELKEDTKDVLKSLQFEVSAKVPRK